MPGRNNAKRKQDFLDGLNEPLPFQRREWVVQRVGWVAFALIVLAGLAGLFGDGPLAHRVAANGALKIEYDRLIRRDAQTTWKLTPLAAPVDGRYRVALDADWAQHYRIHAIQPVPESARLADGRWEYEFEASAGVPIMFHVEARRMGTLRGSVRLDEAPSLELSQFAYP
ncbi:MAG TPA: hypothetical protein VFV88_07475 [Steroidobacteraceae bacterium]|jgi:hypothetical protein|nr:hypothetical protein [Steroidobacteraceae bacterium]